MELQNSYEDDVRFGFEIILSIWISLLLLINFWDIGNCQKTKGNFLKYFLSGWNWVEFCSNGLLFSCMVMWWVISSKYASKFEIPIRRDVYAGLSAEANFLALQSNGAWLNEANNDFEELKQLVDMFNWCVRACMRLRVCVLCLRVTACFWQAVCGIYLGSMKVPYVLSGLRGACLKRCACPCNPCLRTGTLRSTASTSCC